MAYTGRIPLVIANGVKQNGSDVFGVIDPDSGGAATFSVALSADGQLPATHWGTLTPLQTSGDTTDYTTWDTYEAFTEAANANSFKEYVDRRAAEYGRTPVGSVTAFFNAMRNGGMGAEGQDFDAFIASLGLQRIDI